MTPKAKGMPPPSPGVHQLLKMSDERIDSIINKTRERLVVDNSDATKPINDAGIEFVSVIFAAIQDSAAVRKSNNLYLSHLLGHTRR